jgi:hypothetical protein
MAAAVDALVVVLAGGVLLVVAAALLAAAVAVGSTLAAMVVVTSLVAAAWPQAASASIATVAAPARSQTCRVYRRFIIALLLDSIASSPYSHVPDRTSVVRIHSVSIIQPLPPYCTPRMRTY